MGTSMQDDAAGIDAVNIATPQHLRRHPAGRRTQAAQALDRVPHPVEMAARSRVAGYEKEERVAWPRPAAGPNAAHDSARSLSHGRGVGKLGQVFAQADETLQPRLVKQIDIYGRVQPLVRCWNPHLQLVPSRFQAASGVLVLRWRAQSLIDALNHPVAVGGQRLGRSRHLRQGRRIECWQCAAQRLSKRQEQAAARPLAAIARAHHRPPAAAARRASSAQAPDCNAATAGRSELGK